MSDTDLAQAMAALLDDEPTTGVDPLRALQAGRAARRARRVRLGASGAFAAVVIAVLAAWALSSVRPVADVGPVAPAPATSSPTTTPGQPDGPLSVAEPVVVGDAAHGVSYVVFMVRNASDSPVVLDSLWLDGAGWPTKVRLGWDATNLTVTAAAQILYGPPSQSHGVVNAVSNEFGKPGTKLAPGAQYALVLTVYNPCTLSPAKLKASVSERAGNIMEHFGKGMTHYVGPSSGPGPFEGPYQVLVDFKVGSPPSWLATALQDACAP